MSGQTLTIAHLPATPYTLVRLDYLIICQQDYCAAKMLSLFEAWSEYKQDAIEQARYHNQAAAKEGFEPTHDETTWLYNTMENIRQRLLGEYSLKTIGKALKALVDLGFLKTRFNPKHKWDRTKQYQFQPQAVQSAIYQITKAQLEEYMAPKPQTLDFLHLANLPDGSSQEPQPFASIDPIESENFPNGIRKNSQAIPNSPNKESIQENTHKGRAKEQPPAPSVRGEKNNQGEKENNQEKEPINRQSSHSSVIKGGKSHREPTEQVSETERSSAAPSTQITLELITKLVLEALARIGAVPSTEQSLPVKTPLSAPTQSAQLTQKNRPLCEFEQWKQQIEPSEWEAFIHWKSQQAPAPIRDRLGWAYNTLKVNLERARLSWESFRAEKSPKEQSSSSTQADGTPNFKAWEMGQHVEVARQYIANTVAFLREQPWHSRWVEFVNATFPNLFTTAMQEATA